MVIQVVRGIPRKDVYSHLMALCNNSEDFSISKYKDQTDEDLERLTIADAKAMASNKRGSANNCIIGTVRLLPSGDDTTIQFVAKDAISHQAVINPELWRRFIDEVNDYFSNLHKAVEHQESKDLEINREEILDLDSILKTVTEDTNAEVLDMRNVGIGIQEALKEFGESLNDSRDSVYGLISDFANQTTLPTSKLLQDLARDISSTRNFDFSIPLHRETEITQLNSGLASIESKIDRLIPQIRSEIAQPQDEKENIVHQMEYLKTTVASLQKEIAILKQTEYQDPKTEIKVKKEAVFRKRGKIPTLIYPGSINNFRALMDSFLTIHTNNWTSPKQPEYLQIYYSPELRAPGREGWIVSLCLEVNGNMSESGNRATIFGYEKLPDITEVQFLDGLHYFTMGSRREFNDPGRPIYNGEPLIGDSLLLLSQEILRGWKSEEATTLTEPAKPQELWEQIPNVGWYRQALKLWHEGLSTSEIGVRVRKDEQTVRNKIAELRSLYGDSIVPRRRK